MSKFCVRVCVFAYSLNMLGAFVCVGVCVCLSRRCVENLYGAGMKTFFTQKRESR